MLLLLIIIWYFFHNIIIFWPRPWPQPPNIGLRLEVLASFNITGVVLYRTSKRTSTSAVRPPRLDDASCSPYDTAQSLTVCSYALVIAHSTLHADNVWQLGGHRSSLKHTVDAKTFLRFLFLSRFYVLTFFYFCQRLYLKNVQWKFHQDVREALFKPQERINRPRF